MSGYSQLGPLSSTGTYWRVTSWYTVFGQALPDSVRIQVKDSVREFMIHHVGGVTATQTMAYAYAHGWVCRFPKDLSGYIVIGIDSKRDTGTWQHEAANNAENGWVIPFHLKPSSVIIYNGTPLMPAQWSGTTNLTVAVEVRKYDKLTIIN